MLAASPPTKVDDKISVQLICYISRRKTCRCYTDLLVRLWYCSVWRQSWHLSCIRVWMVRLRPRNYCSWPVHCLFVFISFSLPNTTRMPSTFFRCDRDVAMWIFACFWYHLFFKTISFLSKFQSECFQNMCALCFLLIVHISVGLEGGET